MLVRALSSDCMVERYSVSLKETCGKRKFSVLEAREFIHVRLHSDCRSYGTGRMGRNEVVIPVASGYR